jgi:hypothetical protein
MCLLHIVEPFHKVSQIRRAALLAFVFMLALPAACGDTLGRARFSWEAVANPVVSGYKVHWGTASGVYAHTVDAGNVTEVIIGEFSEGIEYFAAITAYSDSGEESDFSTEISFIYDSTAPEIAVEQAVGTDIADGGSKDFGSVNVGSNTSLTFTIRNTGTAALTGLVISKDGGNPSDFTVTSSPVAPVSGPGGTTTFIVQFAPGAVGSRSAAIHIASNDSDENQFDITLTGTGSSVGAIAPDIALEQPARSMLVSGESRSFPTVALRKKATLTFTVRNTLAGSDPGSATYLKISSMSLSGPNADEFHVSVNSINSIKPGRCKTFKVRFAPQSEGNKEALLSIFSNDPDESPYLVRLLGSTPNSGNANKADPVAVTAPLATDPAMVQELALNPTVPDVNNGGLSAQSTQSIVDALPQNDGAKHPDVRQPDDDGAGLYQWLEYAFSGDPARAAEEDAMPRQVMAAVDGLLYPALNFRRLKSTDMLIFVVEESTDMIHWQAVPIPWQLADEIVDEGNGYEWLTVLSSVPLPVDGQLFMRLRVEQGP